MIRPRRTLVSFLGCALVLAGCGVSDDVAADRADFAGAQKHMEHILPLVQEESARVGMELPLENLAERTCLRPEVDAPQEQTSWIGQLSAEATDPAKADAVLEAVSAVLTSEGWTLEADELNPGGDPNTLRDVTYTKDGIIVSATYRLGPTDAVEILATTACVDHPTDHQMLRSTLDPSYGKSHPDYPDGE